MTKPFLPQDVNADVTDQRLAAESHRASWVVPAIQKMRAGDAEVGTQVSGDGAFTTS